MCSPRLALGALAVALSTIAGSAAAQSIRAGAPLRDPAIERANAGRLLAMSADAQRLRAASDSARRHVQFADTVLEGRIRIATTPELLGFGQRIARSAEAMLARSFGPPTQATRMMFVLRNEPTNKLGQRRARLERWIGDSLDGAVRLNLEWSLNGAMFLVDGFAADRFSQLDSTTRGWLRYPLNPVHDAAMERTAIYVDIATSDNRLAAECRAGSIERCREGFAFTPPADPVMSWYEAANRKRIASRSLARRRRDPNLERCMQSDDQACIAELRTWKPSELPPPLSLNARHSLTWVALTLGGDGALERFESSTAAGIEQRLTEAARTSSPKLIAAWRDTIIAARPRPVAASPGTAWAAVIWGSLLGVLSMRSTRWRGR